MLNFEYDHRSKRELPAGDEDERSHTSTRRARRFSYDDYTVGWICALPLEMNAAKAMLDEKHNSLPNPIDDDNVYTLGQMGFHNVVMTCLPSGIYGTTSAALVANKMQSTFRSIRFGLMVGIGGGAPSKFADIRLGDIVVSKPTENFGGVVPYDYGKAIQEGVFKRTGTLNKPPQALPKAVSSLQADKLKSSKILAYLSEAAAKDPDMTDEFTFSDCREDWLFEAQYEHNDSETTCNGCDKSRLVTRSARSTRDPVIHYGLIASGNQVMKHASTRDRLASEYGILCFEMEAAGLMDHFPSLVIRGVCDYSDSHKSKTWQAYAAAVAAAYAKIILSVVPVTQSSRAVATTIAKPSVDLANSDFPEGRGTRNLAIDEAARMQKANILTWLSTFHYRQKYTDLCKRRMKDTGQWLLNSDTFQQWLSKGQSPYRPVWCCGDPGTGKSVLASLMIDHIMAICSSAARSKAIAYHFVDHLDEASGNCLTILRSILHQLSEQLDPLPMVITTLFEDLYKKGKEIGFDETKLAIRACINMLDQVFVVIDALDEAPAQERSSLLSTIKEFSSQCKIIVTSRPHLDDISRTFHDDPSIDVTAQDSDLQLYLRSRMSSTCHSFVGNEDFMDQIIHTIIEHAHGLFLLAVLHIDNVLNEPTIGDALVALSSISSNLQLTFQTMLKRIANQQNQNRVGLATRALAVLAYVKRPLQAIELCDILSVRPNQTHLNSLFRPSCATVLDCCGGLVVLDKNTSTIHLVHYTLQEYIRTDPFGQEIAPPTTVARLCLEYLGMDDFASGSFANEQEIFTCIMSYPFYPYAARWWGHHVNGDKSLIGSTLDLLWSSPHRATLAQVFMYDAGLREEYWCAEEANSNNPLTVAAWYHMHEVSRILLDDDCIPVDSATSLGTTALIRSTSENDVTLAKMLIERGADPYGCNWYGSSLHCVAESGHCEVMEYLLNLGLDVDSRDHHGRTPLHCAAQRGRSGVVRLLLDRGASIDVISNAGLTPLGEAVLSQQDCDFCFFLMEQMAMAGTDVGLVGLLALLDPDQVEDV
ncbi:hypothetical protein LTR84_005949 [Exophiala bonariae]|uniref:Nucleoside phosphorylase domain-containing protein n=1 Tax=Exophiala bonariae TaxID=1690606 RepID=A0AAV9N2G0_9EURO|nr:hypothetical protein LTR84_005949 [Exophiala bonariae]